MATGLLDQQSWMKSQGNRNWTEEWFNSFDGDGLDRIGKIMGAAKRGEGPEQYVKRLYDQYATGSQGAADQLVKTSQDQGDRQGLLGDHYAALGDTLRNPNSAGNQFNLRNMSAQFNSMQPKYQEIGAQQGIGGSVTAMQTEAAKRNAGLLTNANFGTMMQDNQKAALGYYGQAAQAYGNQSQSYGQAEQANQGLLSLEYQDKWEQAKLKEQQKEYEDQKGSFWGDLLNIGTGIIGSFAGGLGGSYGKKWAG